MATKIEWVKNADGSQGYTINPIKGLCPMDCKDNQDKSYCYARRMYKRFKWNPEIRFEGVINLSVELLRITKPSNIFVGSTMELFGDWIKPEWIRLILEATKLYSQHTFIFLTKQPQNLKKWSPFPKNCWVGASATNHQQYKDAVRGLREIEASVIFLSFEPLLSKIETSYDTFDWVIIGQQTPPNKLTTPKIEWIDKIIKDAEYLETPIYLKNNLAPLLVGNKSFSDIDPKYVSKDGGFYTLRHEYPKGVR